MSVSLGQASHFITYVEPELIIDQIDDPAWVGSYTISVVLADSVGSQRSYSITVELETNEPEKSETEE